MRATFPLALLACLPLACAREKTPEQQAVAEIEKMGGFVHRDEKSPGKPVESISFWKPERNYKVTDEGLVQLKHFPGLRLLDLADTRVTDLGLAHLGGLSELRWLVIRSTKVSGKGLAHLKGLTKLEFLD